MTITHNSTKAAKRKSRVRGRMQGTADRPRLTIHRTNKHLALQVINDDKQVTLAQASDVGKENTLSGSKMERAKKVTKALLPLLKKAKITKLVFDRGAYKYHGRVKIVAETLREGGIQL